MTWPQVGQIDHAAWAPVFMMSAQCGAADNSRHGHVTKMAGWMEDLWFVQNLDSGAPGHGSTSPPPRVE